MNNTIEEKIGNVCKGIQESIDTLPLPSTTKIRVKSWLDECADKASREDGDTVSNFNREVDRFYRNVERRTGHKLPRSKKIVA